MATRETLEPRVAACKSAEDLYTLAREAFETPADPAYAKELFSRPEFTGDAGAKAFLDDTAGSAMFTKDFIALAMGYKALGDGGQAEAMMGQGQDFAMSGEEKVAVGVGLLLVTGDAAGAVKALSGALKEISSTDELYGLAQMVAGELKEAASGLLQEVYEKIKAKAGRAGDFARLAKSIAQDLGDKVKAVAVINEGAAKYGSPSDLISLSGVLSEIDASAAGTLYAKALESAKDFIAVKQVLAAAKDNTEFTKAVLAKGAEIATASPELLELAAVSAAIGDKAGAVALLGRAEELVANLDDMRKVVEAAEQYVADDAARVAGLKERLAKREANQAKYVEFQNEEAKVTTVKQFIALADRVLAELEDKAYAGKLLSSAEAMLRESGFHFSRFKPLILAVDRLGDKAWLGKLLDESVASAADFVWFREVVLTAARELKDAEFGRTKAKEYLTARAAQASDNPYDYTKLAETVRDALNDAAWATQLLAEAAKRAKDHYALAYIGKLYRDLGDAGNAKAQFDKAVAACASGEACVQLARRLKDDGMANAEIAGLMEACGAKLASANDKLCWAEGVADLLLDAEWAARAYAAIAGAFADEVGKKRFERSRQMRLGYRYFGPGVQAH
ncbi:hypothetical protein EDC61_1165 [Sulfuritortus calidifontis]|uniref:Tetratricopeptide repeat protein n=1 Tax=Sulfuritortus calidifontis TaxID=1914471 RepID=A0A4R3JSX7_9PROT|nr:hypothetical protein [Sulfuritortus calidifontis]TCS70406.1 hypothetical protein EDC61_1165 [Sulfuritortus calidifontis]